MSQVLSPQCSLVGCPVLSRAPPPRYYRAWTGIQIQPLCPTSLGFWSVSCIIRATICYPFSPAAIVLCSTSLVFLFHSLEMFSLLWTFDHHNRWSVPMTALSPHVFMTLSSLPDQHFISSLPVKIKKRHPPSRLLVFVIFNLQGAVVTSWENKDAQVKDWEMLGHIPVSKLPEHPGG
jgi:hypothetical protein